ncbi:hypothetical protein [Streptomyces sp. NPDC003077]|uniref:hypothetical protein n=1 Tax=Streptomyces sp. NPDC003077 TaxID=3154443 RepID=UPI0033AF39DC
MTEATRNADETDGFSAFCARMRTEQRVLGVVLSGSQAREGMATERSDHDVLVVVEDGAEQAFADESRRGARMDVTVMPLRDFRAHALPGSDTEWNRYAFTHARIIKDTPDGRIAELARAKGRLTPDEAARTAPQALDAFLNGVYRCLKNDRDGLPLGARLDAAEALPFYLTYVFALHERVRPYNKYLSWELRHHPLDRPEWSHDRLMASLEQALSPSPVTAIRRLFNELEPRARAAGHGPVLDSWGEDLFLMRGGGAVSP